MRSPSTNNINPFYVACLKPRVNRKPINNPVDQCFREPPFEKPWFGSPLFLEGERIISYVWGNFLEDQAAAVVTGFKGTMGMASPNNSFTRAERVTVV